MSDIDPFPAPPGGSETPPPVPSAPTEPEPERRRSTVGIWIGLAALVVLLGVAALALTASEPEPEAAPVSSSTEPSAQTSPSGAGDGAVTIDAAPRSTLVPDGAAIPAWSAPTLDGETFDWTERPTGPSVLAIWAPWCPHCQAELPRLSAAVERHPGISLVSIATAVDEAGPTPQEYMESEGLGFTVALDDEMATLAAGLGVQGFPTTYFVDASGRVLASASGELDPDALEDVLSFLEDA